LVGGLRLRSHAEGEAASLRMTGFAGDSGFK
jgi:hypothetical protein